MFLISEHVIFSRRVSCVIVLTPSVELKPITSNNRVVIALVDIFYTFSVKGYTAHFYINDSKVRVIIMFQLKSIYNSPFTDSYSHPIHTCFR